MADNVAVDTDEIHLRRIEEVEALLSYYGEDDFKRSLNEFNVSSSSSSPCSEYSSSRSSTTTPSVSRPPPLVDGPWFLRLRLHHDNTATLKNSTSNHNNNNNDATLELRLPIDYPLGSTPPTPILHMMQTNNNMHSNINGTATIDSNTKRHFLQQLQEDYMEGTCVGIYWGECCREFLLENISSSSSSSSYTPTQRQTDVECEEDTDGGVPSVDASLNSNNCNSGNGVDHDKTITFLPSTTRFHQPIRHFPSSILSNPIYQCTIHRTPPFHPPNSGPSECLIAHVAKVTCMEHVLWTLGQLLLNDKKVAKASHNMFAYRFYTSSSSSSCVDDDKLGGSGGSRGRVLVSDNDDDGEKGSGKKLSALLELCHAENVFVVVSRWFGGELLGAARFKWIASVAKDGLVQAGVVTT